MFRLIYRQRRRIIFGTLFIVLFGIVSLDSHELFAWDVLDVWWQNWLFFGTFLVIASLAFMPIIALFIALFPRWRHIIELLSMFMFLEACADRIGLFDPIAEFAGAAGPLVWFLCFMAFYTVTYGNGLDRLHAKLGWKSTRSIKAPQSAQEAWTRFVTDPDHVDEHWDPLLRSVSQQEEDDTFEVEYTMGPSVFQHQTQTVLEQVPQQKFRYHFMGEVNPKNRSLSEGIFEISLAEIGNECRISLTEQQSSLMPREALGMWFDDYLGDRLDSYLARLRGKRDWSISGLIRRQILNYS